jgi:hypothetical protein
MELKVGSEVSSEAFVVHVQSFEESHKILQVFTLDFGKISCFARGAVRSQKRFGSQLDLGNTLRVHLQKPKQKLWTLKKVELLNMPIAARGSLSNLDAIFFLLSALKDLFQEEQEDRVVFEMSRKILELLEIPRPALQLSWMKLSLALWFQQHMGYGDDVYFLQDKLGLEEEDFEGWKSNTQRLSFLTEEGLKDFERYPRIGNDAVRAFYNNWREVSGLPWAYFERVM